MEKQLSEIFQKYEGRIEELEEKLAHEIEMKNKYKNQMTTARQQARKKQEKLDADKALKKKYRSEIETLEKRLNNKINYIKKEYQKDNGNIVKHNGKYIAYVEYSGRKMKLGEYKNRSEADEAVTRAESALRGA